MKNYNEEIKRCIKCIMPEVPGHIKLDQNGICDICNSTINIKKNLEYNDCNIEEFKKKILFYDKKRGHYNCAVSVSGGKDSIMTLYIAKKVLGLNVLAIFIDNGFVLPEMYENLNNAVEILDIDLVIFKTSNLKSIFKKCIESKKEVYYCRVCHVIMEYYVKKVCHENKVDVLLGGYTKGQQYIKNSELFWIYDKSDNNIVDIFKEDYKFNNLAKMFKNPTQYIVSEFGNIVQISPFKYIKWDENEILDLLTKELKFKLSKNSWPDKSSNCIFNYVSQFKAIKEFGYAQHETELSELIREGELSRQRAIEIINTPIYEINLRNALSKIDLNINDIVTWIKF